MIAESQWKIAYASVIGTSHIEKGTECQDRFEYKSLDTPRGETLVVVLSDGAGRSEFSQIGAELACNFFISEIEKLLSDEEGFDNLNRNFAIDWLYCFRQKITEYAEEEEKNVKDFACTFLAGIIWDDGAVFYQVGDGGIIYSPTGESDSFCFGILPATKEYANATDFITEKSAEKRLLCELVQEPIKELAMFTDGIERLATNISAGLPHEPFLIPMMTPLREVNYDSEILNEKLATFFNSPRINEKTDDDKTLFLASRISLENKNLTSEKAEENNKTSKLGTSEMNLSVSENNENSDNEELERNIIILKNDSSSES